MARRQDLEMWEGDKIIRMIRIYNLNEYKLFYLYKKFINIIRWI
jgi:hypothetical protein